MPTCKPSRPTRKTKTRFILIDAVGVSESEEERLRSRWSASEVVALRQADRPDRQGRRDEDAPSTLAGRLAALDRKLADEDRVARGRPPAADCRCTTLPPN